MLAESRLRFRVWPSDCDLNLHMNNGRYLTFMDLGRVHLISQIGALRFLITQRWAPVLSAAEINFVRPLAPFAGFELITRMLTWDEKYFYLEQRFESGERLNASATVRGLFLAGGKPLPTREVVRLLGMTESPPPMPDIVRHWNELTALKKEHAARSAG
jgi:acyl-CoA thioesterase FadM